MVYYDEHCARWRDISFFKNNKKDVVVVTKLTHNTELRHAVNEYYASWRTVRRYQKAKKVAQKKLDKTVMKRFNPDTISPDKMQRIQQRINMIEREVDSIESNLSRSICQFNFLEQQLLRIAKVSAKYSNNYHITAGPNGTTNIYFGGEHTPCGRGFGLYTIGTNGEYVCRIEPMDDNDEYDETVVTASGYQIPVDFANTIV